MSNLTPQLNDQQLRENIDALQKGGQSLANVQSYVNNYEVNPTGGYRLKTQGGDTTPGAGTAPPDNSNFMQRVGIDKANVSHAVQNTANDQVAGKISYPEAILRTMAQYSSVPFTVAGEGVKSIVKGIGDAGNATRSALGIQPSHALELSQHAKDVANNMKDSVVKDVNSVVQPVKQFVDKHPTISRVASDVGAAGTVALNALPLAGALKAGATGVADELSAVARANADKSAAVAATNFDDAIGKVVRGTTKDIATTKSALTTVDLSHVKTYQDLRATLDANIKTLSGKVDEALATSKGVKKLNEFSVDHTVGGQTVTKNYVSDALDELTKFYQKTNNAEGEATIASIRQKAETEGLNAQDVNNLAKIHGRDLNGFNASGELASGLSKQAAENTRTGLKGTSREMFGSDVTDIADKHISTLIRVRDLADKMVEEVNNLRQRISQRGIGEKLGRAAFQALNLASGKSIQGFIQSWIPRGSGLKLVNALEAEKGLQKNLAIIQKALSATASDEDIAGALDKVIGSKPPGSKVVNSPKELPPSMGAAPSKFTVCLDRAEKNMKSMGYRVVKGVYDPGAKTIQEAEHNAVQHYLSVRTPLAKLGKNTHAWNVTSDGKVFDNFLQKGVVKKPYQYVSEERILELIKELR